VEGVYNGCETSKYEVEMKRVYDNERGFALVMALILSVIVLATVSALLYLIIQGTSMSGYQKRYATSLESAKGGADFVTKAIIPLTFGQVSVAALTTIEGTLKTQYNVSSPLPLNLQFPSTTPTCLYAKLTTTTWVGTTDNWQAAGCTADMESTTLIKPGGAVVSDVSFVLPGPVGTTEQNFIVYAKIVDTITGNSSTSGVNLIGGGVVSGNSGMVPVQQSPFMFRIDIQAQRQNNPDEQSTLSVLYAY
jgi:hypothetical protein